MKLSIKNLSVNLGEKRILRNINLEINSGELHVLMGPNGSGKSTLAQSLMGNPIYEFQIGKGAPDFKFQINKKSLINLKTEERAKKGLFLAFQNPVGIPGVSVANLLRTAYQEISKNGQNKKKKNLYNPALSLSKFNEFLIEKCRILGIPQEFLRRSLNEEFSGGEKKKLEMLQVVVLNPKFAIFDEVDTGLDVDALKTVALGIREIKEKGAGVLVVTHYQRILKYLSIDKVHILVEGKIIESGGRKLVDEVEKEGYRRWINKKNEFNS